MRCFRLCLPSLATVLFAFTVQASKATGRAADGGAAGSRELSEQEQRMFELINSDPLDLKNTLPGDYSNWASLLSHVLLKKEVHESAANTALVHLGKLMHKRLMKISEGDLTPPMLALQDEIFHDGQGEKVAIPRTSITGLATSKVFFNYAPCIFQSAVTQAGVGAYGVNFSPSLFYFSPGLANFGLTGLNFAPSAILVAPNVANVVPVGINVVPALAAITPTGVGITPGGINIAPQLANIQPIGVNINPQGLADNTAVFNFGPVGVGDGAQDPNSNPIDPMNAARPRQGGPTNVSNALQPRQGTPSQTAEPQQRGSRVTPQPLLTDRPFAG